MALAEESTINNDASALSTQVAAGLGLRARRENESNANAAEQFDGHHRRRRHCQVEWFVVGGELAACLLGQLERDEGHGRSAPFNIATQLPRLQRFSCAVITYWLCPGYSHPRV